MPRKQFKSREDMELFINSNVTRINKISDYKEYVKEIITFAGNFHPSDAYVLIKDKFKPKKNLVLEKCKYEDPELYKEFQTYFYDEFKKSYDHDNAQATNLDVDKAVSRAYSISVGMIGKLSNMSDDRFNKVAEAINKIEEHLGLDVTDFSEADENDTKQTDVQRN